MKDWRQRQQEQRCGDKKMYRDPEIADRKAANASRRTNELIVSYKCIDCGCWHIGHADYTDMIVRNDPPVMNCVECGEPIPAARLLEAQRSKITIKTCSPHCSLRGQRRRNRKRRRARNRQQPPGSEGCVPSPP